MERDKLPSEGNSYYYEIALVVNHTWRSLNFCTDYGGGLQ